MILHLVVFERTSTDISKIHDFSTDISQIQDFLTDLSGISRECSVTFLQKNPVCETIIWGIHKIHVLIVDITLLYCLRFHPADMRIMPTILTI